MLRKQLQLLDDYFWLKLKYSWKYKLLFIILFVAALSAILITFTSISNWLPNLNNLFIPKLEVASAVATLYVQNSDSIKFSPSADENTCYWISPDYYGDSFVIELEKTYSPTQDCYGDVISKSYIPVSKPVSITGNSSCFCGSKVVELKKLFSDEDLFLEVVK